MRDVYNGISMSKLQKNIHIISTDMFVAYFCENIEIYGVKSILLKCMGEGLMLNHLPPPNTTNTVEIFTSPSDLFQPFY